MPTEPTQQNDGSKHPTTLPLLAMIGVLAMAVAPISAGAAPAPREPAYDSAATNCRVVDGDTLHCDGGRIRLLGIDAPELPGHCAQGRDCAPGDPYESSRSLGDAMGDGASLRIAIVGTDAPLTSSQLGRICKRAALGIGRVGSYAAHGSGEILLAFSTANRVPRGGTELTHQVVALYDRAIGPLYEAAIEATEEAIVNALCAAGDMTGQGGNFAPGLPLERVAELMKRYRPG